MSEPTADGSSLHRRVLVTDWHARVSPIAKLIRMWLKTGPRTTALPSVVVVGPAAIAEEMGLTDKAVRSAIAELEAAGLVVADWGARVVWMPERLGEAAPSNPNTVRSWRRPWASVPVCALRDRVAGQLVEHLTARGQAFLDAADFLVTKGNNRSGNDSPDGSGNGTAAEDLRTEDLRTEDLRTEFSPEVPSPGMLPLGLAVVEVPAVSAVERERVDVMRVHAHWRTYHPKAAAGLDRQSRSYRNTAKRLSEGSSVETLCAAVDGCHRDPWRVQHRAIGLDQIMSDPSLVARFAEGVAAVQRDPRTVEARNTTGARRPTPTKPPPDVLAMMGAGARPGKESA